MFIQVVTQLQSGTQPRSRVEVNHSPHYQNVHQEALSTQRTVTNPVLPTTAHTVRDGDNLSRIVREFYESQGQQPSLQQIYSGVEDVARSNGLADPDKIFPGQQIDLSTLGGNLRSLPPGQQLSALSTPLPRVQSAPVAPVTVAPEIRPARPAATPLPAVDTALDKHAEVLPSALGGPETSPTAERALEMIRQVPEHLTSISDLIRDVMNGRRVENPVAVRAPWHNTIGGESRLTSNYGMRKDPFNGQPGFHDGIDLAADAGSPIYPVEPGRVTFSGWQSGYGRVVIVEHENGLESVYAHNDLNHVEVGDVVTKETVLADVGTSGRSTGPHLHLEIRKHGKAVNPISHLGGEHHHIHPQGS